MTNLAEADHAEFDLDAWLKFMGAAEVLTEKGVLKWSFDKSKPLEIAFSAQICLPERTTDERLIGYWRTSQKRQGLKRE
jgi:hypothetical protein